MGNDPDEDKDDTRTKEEGTGKKFCDFIGCPNGFTPIPYANDVACYGNKCEVEQCCEAFCSYHACPNNFVPVKDADSIKCTRSKCSTEQCCDEVKANGGGGGGGGKKKYCKDVECPQGYVKVTGYMKHMECDDGSSCIEQCCDKDAEFSYDDSSNNRL